MTPVNTVEHELPASLDTAAARFERDGFCLTPPIIPDELIAAARGHVRDLMSGHYETGIEPGYPKVPAQVVEGEPTRLYRLYQPHLADNTMRALVTHPELGRWAAAAVGTDWIQMWGALLLYKPVTCGTDIGGNIGWHQDQHYFTTVWEPGSEVFFASLAISEIGEDAGPVLMVRGSHRWGYRGQGDFYEQDQQRVRNGIDVPAGERWEEVPMVLPPGAVSFHHRNTFHGSGPNHSGRPRISVVVEMRTRNSTPIADSDSYYVKHLNDPRTSPVIYGG